MILFILIFVGLCLLLSWGVYRLINYQDYQCFDPMHVGEYRCCWHESGFSYARVKVQEWRSHRWVTVWAGRLGVAHSYMEHILPNDLRRMYEEEVCAYIKWRDAWAKEREVIDSKAMTR